MGLLDDLKKQAEHVRAKQLAETELSAEVIAAVDAKMKQAFTYLNDLLNQIKVLKPHHPLTYTLPGIGELKGLDFGEAFIDYRRKKINDKEALDTIKLFIRWQGTNPLLVERDMPGTIEKTRETLWQCRAKFDEDEVRTQYGTVSSVRFRIQDTILGEVFIKADYEHRRLLILTGNLLRVGHEYYEVPVVDAGEQTFEALAHMLLGRNSDLGKYRSANTALIMHQFAG